MLTYSVFNVISQSFLGFDDGYLDKSDSHAPVASHDHLPLDVWPPCHQEVSAEAGDFDAVAVGSDHTYSDADADDCVDAGADAIGSDHSHGDGDGCADTDISHVDGDGAVDGAWDGVVLMVILQVMVVASREDTGGIPAPSITIMAIQEGLIFNSSQNSISTKT